MANFELTASLVLYKTDRLEIQNVIRRLSETQLKWKLFLIDNSPTPDLKHYFDTIEHVEYIFLDNNVGFGKGHNLAIDTIKESSDFHLILNADIDFKGLDLEQMVHYMRQHKEIGLLAPKVLNMDGTIQYSAKLLPRPVDLIVRRFLPFKPIQDYYNNRFELRFLSFDKIMQTPCFNGCFLLINCAVFTDVKGFDERFFMYSEDVDLTRRINQKYKTLYYPEVSIYHEHGRGSYKNFKLLYYHMRSMILYFNKWGWFFDNDRKQINKKTLLQVRTKM